MTGSFPSIAIVARHIRCHWPMKLWLGSALTVLFCGGYFAIERHPSRPPAQLALSKVDRWVGFSPGWAWVYQSIYLLLPLAWLARTREELWRYAAGFVLLTLVGFACFLAWPVAGPRPADVPTRGAYGWLVRYDEPLNCFPSLHLALATYTFCVALAVTGGHPRRVLAVLLPAWVALIGYATLATKQHYAVDLPPGVVLGWLARRWAWRSDAPWLRARLALAAGDGR